MRRNRLRHEGLVFAVVGSVGRRRTDQGHGDSLASGHDEDGQDHESCKNLPHPV
jgi:hypothetical protein